MIQSTNNGMGNNARTSSRDGPPSSVSACDTCTFQSLHVTCYVRPGLLRLISTRSQFCVIAVDTRCWISGGVGEGGGDCIVSFVRRKLRQGVQPMASSLIHGTPFRHIKLFPSSRRKIRPRRKNVISTSGVSFISSIILKNIPCTIGTAGLFAHTL